MREFYFERLRVWQNAKEFTKDIYLLTAHFPDDEKFGITSQIRRATLSICANIAEGSARNTPKDRAKFINQSFSSAIEVLNFLILIKDLELINTDQYSSFREKIEKITNQLNALSKKIKEEF
ncbi:four helix bundle protein [Flavobacterium sp. JP2137]|uniref:four helix bundle protein n=1 Tax=Flavobacterium sp. JP2137 TaxID=3414510 RepID=UPI003D2FB3B4